MNVPNVEIKNYKPHYSREWGPNGAFNCDLWINGIKCMNVHDDGNGGCYDYQSYDYQNPKAELIKANIKLLEAHIKSLPKIKSTIDNHEFPMDMDMFVAEKISELEKQKADKKLKKEFASKICYGVPNGESYSYTYWKGRTLAQIPLPTLQKVYDEVKATKLKGGAVILNDNLKALGVKL